MIGLTAGQALAGTSLDVEVGWGGAYRYAKWTPVFITASDDRLRNAVIEVVSPHNSMHSMRVRQMVSIGPTALTFPIYVPMGTDISDLAVTLRDAGNGRRLTGWNAQEAMSDGGFTTEYTSQLIGVSGRSRMDRLLEAQLLKGDSNTIRGISPSRLPTNAQGLDALDLLILDDPDFARIAPEQQNAIVDWVRAGGQLLCWIGADAVAPSGTIINVLPADIGSTFLIELSDETLLNAGLAERFGKLPGRQLSPRAGTVSVPLFNGAVNGYRRSLGFGSVTLLPINPSTLMFSTPEHSYSFWQPIIGTLAVQGAPEKKTDSSYYQRIYSNLANQKSQQAAIATMDMLGSVPGAGSFGFSYVVIVMLGMMLIVGPIDWIVLKKLNAQPWTWATTTGWIVLVTFGAIFMGYAFKSGDLHFRSIQVVDQADGMTLATVEAFGIYSPRTQEYRVKVDPAGWWEPLAIDYYGSSRRTTSAMDFHEDGYGVRPQPMLINVWNLQFLKSETRASSPPLIESNLHIATRNGVDYVAGTVTNRSDSPLGEIQIRRKDKLAILPPSVTIDPQSSINVNAALSSNAYSKPAPEDPNTHDASELYSREQSVALVKQFDLAAQRSVRIDEMLLGREDLACIYAISGKCPSSVQLETTGAIEKHSRYIRALVPLNKGGI